MRRGGWAALLGLAAATPAAAAEPAWTGVWTGTIGALPVQVCLEAPPEGSDYSHGSYYYLSRKVPITLQHEDDGGWSESSAGKQTGRWTVAPQGTDRLAGEWRSGARRLPIALKRVPDGDEGEGACASEAYLAPRVTPVQVVRKPARSGGYSYTRLRYEVGPSFADVSIESFAIPETQPGDRAINAALRYDPARRDGDADYLGCYAGALGSVGLDGEFIALRAPRLVTRDFLVVQENSGGSCGGAHPDYGYVWKVWDRQDGKPVDLAGWLDGKAFAAPPDADNGGLWTIAPALRRLAVRHLQIQEQDCRDTIESADYWNLGLAAGGLVLTPSLPHVAAACGDDAIVPFAEIAPFLSPAGKAQVARFRRAPAQVIAAAG